MNQSMMEEEFNPNNASPQMSKKGKIILIVSLLIIFALFFVQHIRTENVYGVYKDAHLGVVYANSSNCSREWFGSKVTIDGLEYYFSSDKLMGSELKTLFGVGDNSTMYFSVVK